MIRRAHLEWLQLRVRGIDDTDWRLHVPTEGANVLFLTGNDAMRVAGLLLPALNRFGGSAAHTEDAVRLLARESAAANFARVIRMASGDDGYIARMPSEFRLALEMAAHEEQERRAMEGELAELERAWREAEEIAAIADDMFLPPIIGEQLRRLRGG